ncbi:MAG: hypothetical protein JWP82_1240 [Humibacillus sp.]|nr:hypothetical protein [Humibacillus sp.]
MKLAGRIKLTATLASVVRAATRPGGPSVAERAQAVPRLVRATVDGTYAGTTLGRLGLVAGALAYVASPLDLLPEAFLPVVGAADDALVIGWAIKAFVEETDRFIEWERGRATTGPASSAWAAPSASSASPASADAGRDYTGAAAPQGGSGPAGWSHAESRGKLPEGVRQAAVDSVMESVRKRLER